QNATVRFTLGDRTIRREVRTGSGYCSAHDPTVQIGLGINKAISGVEVTWSDGTKQAIGKVRASSTEIIHQKK
ncbi:ASPIC/UnbV domain-containing protein, partial [PVC group bacterium]|nr:ASPIC/UnbV domain-containing protein [PVC group bacterium]